MKNAFLNAYQIHDYRSNPNGIYLKPDIQGLEMPTIRLPNFERPNIDGAFVPNQLYGGRAISLQGKVSAQNVQNYRLRRRAFQNAVKIYRPGGALAPIVFKFKTMDDLELQTNVYLRKIEFPDVYLTGGAFKIDLFAPDVALESQELHIEEVSIFSGGGMAIPMEIPLDMSVAGTLETIIANAGDTGALPTITITGTIEDPTISNQTTGESFSLDYELTTEDERIEVDVKNRSVLYYADDNASGVNIRDKFSGDWMEIAAGENAIKLVVADSTDSGSAVIRWRDAYLGV